MINDLLRNPINIPSNRSENLNTIKIHTQNMMSLPYIVHGKETIVFYNEDEKKDYTRLIEDQAETQRTLSKLSPTTPAFHELKKKLFKSYW